MREFNGKAINRVIRRYSKHRFLHPKSAREIVARLRNKRLWPLISSKECSDITDLPLETFEIGLVDGAIKIDRLDKNYLALKSLIWYPPPPKIYKPKQKIPTKLNKDPCFRCGGKKAYCSGQYCNVCWHQVSWENYLAKMTIDYKLVNFINLNVRRISNG